MKTISVSVSGLDKVLAALRGFGAEVEKGIADALNASALEGLTDVKNQIQRGIKTGRVYRRGKVVHRASAPGEAPATDTGTLVNSLYYSTPDPLTAVFGSRLAYAEYLEFGTREIAKRPAFIPAVERLRPRLEKRLERVIAKAKAQAKGAG